jgi:hypothetical protein
VIGGNFYLKKALKAGLNSLKSPNLTRRMLRDAPRFHGFFVVVNLGGGLGPLVWEEIENAQTVHKPKLKFIYTKNNKHNKQINRRLKL